MATDEGPGPGSGGDTASGVSHEALGYDHPDAEEYAALAADLRERVAGRVRFDEYARTLYATDGSIYRADPAGVVTPEDAADVRATVAVAADHGVPVLPRGAGSSLAGQAVGPGCVVLDCSRHMDGIVEIDPEAREAVVQPGVVQDDLDARLADHGLKFAPDPASSNRATVGGGIGNNSTGAHSVRYGITDAYVEELEVVLADGSQIRTREVALDSPEWADLVGKDDLEAALYETVRAVVEENEDEIAAKYPTLERSVSGYNLQKVITEREGERVIDLSKLFVGAEGTLGVVTEATLSLVTKPAETALAVFCFEDLLAAMRAVPEALALGHGVSAVELMDEEVFRLARDSTEYAEYAEPIPEGTTAALMLEWDSEQCDDFEAAVGEARERFLGGGSRGGDGAGAAFDAIEAYAEAEQDRLWKLRKAAIPLLMSLEGDPKPYPFVEDASVPPADLAAYVRDFQEILERHGTSAAYFAHAGAGTLHIRPVLNLKEEEGVETMHAIADDVTDLVTAYDGSFSGEHGDGLARTEFNPKLYGPDLWAAFKRVKSAADPDWLMNPGKVVYREDDPTDIREHLRYGPEYASIEPQTELNFSEEGGFSHLVELCNGCGTCRQTGEEVMCPTYRASQEEIQTTRGRANMLRAAISGDLPEDELYTEQFQAEVLDLCVGCKGCQSDCPTGVDLAKLKAEVKHEYHEREGVSLRERLFGNVDSVAAWGSRLAPLSNWLARLPGSGALGERLLGVAAEREPPAFRRNSFVDWFEAREPGVTELEADRRVLLFPDTYTNYVYPAAGKAAVEVLEAAGAYVRVPETPPSGRAAYSEGLLGTARERARGNVEALSPRVAEGWAVLFVEPSDAAMFQDEYADLLPGDERVPELGARAYGVCEYLHANGLLDELPLDGSGAVTYHGHCNQKALGRDGHAARAMERAGYEVEALDSTCCGMAGSFGYEAEHYDLSRAIGSLLFDQVDESGGEPVAPGASCRTQLGDRAGGERPPHPVEKLAAALPGRRQWQ
jgi:FAD/FMN-containing dehydrogenase/Fe-S oxidoreductase